MDLKLIAAANLAGHQVIDQGPVLIGAGNVRHGVLCAANEASFNNSFLSEALTTFVGGMPDQDMVQEELDFIAPMIPAGRRFEYRKFGNTQQVLSETDDTRGTGAQFKTVEFKGDIETGRTVNKGLAYIGDLDVLGDIPNWEQLYAGWLRVRTLRNELRRAYTALLALHVGTEAKWSSDPTTDPTVDLIDLVETLGDATGLDANALVIGRSAWAYGRRNLRAKKNVALAAEWSAAPLADAVGVDVVRLSKARYAVGEGAKTRMLAAYAVAFHRTVSGVMEDPSSIKRFVTTSGGAFQVYRRELGAKLVEISVGHYSNIVGLGTARRLNVE
jgi:hypothetical protein